MDVKIRLKERCITTQNNQVHNKQPKLYLRMWSTKQTECGVKKYVLLSIKDGGAMDLPYGQ